MTGVGLYHEKEEEKEFIGEVDDSALFDNLKRG